MSGDLEAKERRELQAAVTAAMLRVFDKMQRHRRLTRDYGTGDQLTMVEAEVCQAIAAEGEVAPSDLAERLGVSRSAVSQALSRLRARNLITVDPDPDDGKGRIVRPTADGLVVAKGVHRLHAKMSRAVYSGSVDELETFLALFNNLDAFFDDVIAETSREASARRRPAT
jgi:DNA-binding MarR family transcriptional regulator